MTDRVWKPTADVQAIWRKHGWTPPSQDPIIIAKWTYFQTLHLRSEEVPAETGETGSDHSREEPPTPLLS